MMARHTRQPRGALLLECLLALSVLVMSFMAILSIVSDTSGAVLAAGRRQTAFDLARSALAEIEAGISTPEALSGPVPAWVDPELVGLADDDAPPDRRGLLWELTVDASPTEFEGLSLVTVIAEGRPVGASADVVASAKLSQLVRLVPSAEDGVGESDRLSEEAKRGAERERPRFPSEVERGGGNRRTRP